MVNLRLLRIFRLHTTDDLIAELNLCPVNHSDEVDKRASDLSAAIEQRAWEYLCCPCDDVTENLGLWGH